MMSPHDVTLTSTDGNVNNTDDESDSDGGLSVSMIFLSVVSCLLFPVPLAITTILFLQRRKIPRAAKNQSKKISGIIGHGGNVEVTANSVPITGDVIVRLPGFMRNSHVHMEIVEHTSHVYLSLGDPSLNNDTRKH